jgi:hypothetical protein
MFEIGRVLRIAVERERMRGACSSSLKQEGRQRGGKSIAAGAAGAAVGRIVPNVPKGRICISGMDAMPCRKRYNLAERKPTHWSNSCLF